MNAYSTNEQINQNNEQDEKVPYETPELTDMGKVEELTALLFHGVPDVLGVGHGNLI